MSIFHGDKYGEDPQEFLDWFLQCTKNGDDSFRARNFVNYLQADSIADKWFEELLEKEKRSWASIEVEFRREWLKQETGRPKEVVTIEKLEEPQSAPTPSQTITLNPHHKTSTQDIPEVDTKLIESQYVNAASLASMTAMTTFDPKTTPEFTQNQCLDTPKQALVALRPASTLQATSTDPNPSQVSLSTTTIQFWSFPHQKALLSAKTPQKSQQKLAEGTQGIPKPTSPLDFDKNWLISLNLNTIHTSGKHISAIGGQYLYRFW
jgi:hypothetical protein